MIYSLLSVNPLVKLKENIEIGMRVKGVRRSGKEKDGLVTQILDENNYNENLNNVEIK